MTETLPEALVRHRIELPTNEVEQLAAYCRELWDWNSRLNLTRHTDYEKFVSRDLRDSLELSALLQSNEEVLDLGSGGGVPGIVLAILRPDLEISLSESVGKKAAALSAMVESLELSVAVHHCRAEELFEEFRFDSVVARAVGPLDKMLSWLEKSWLSFNRLLAIKGPRWLEEEKEAAQRLRGLDLQVKRTYPMSGTDSESVILEIRKKK